MNGATKSRSLDLAMRPYTVDDNSTEILRGHPTMAEAANVPVAQRLLTISTIEFRHDCLTPNKKD
jgi:hypothetical protein